MAARRIEGAVHSTADGPSSRIGTAANNSKAHTGATNCRCRETELLRPMTGEILTGAALPARPGCTFLAELDFMVLHDNGMFFELLLFFRKISAEMCSPAFAPGERATGNQQRDGVHVAQAVIAEAGGRIGRHAVRL